MAGKINFNFECINAKEYELDLIMEAKSNALKKLWKKSAERILKKKGDDIKKEGYKNIQEFGIPETYFKFLKMNSKGIITNIINQLQEDKIHVISYEVIGGKYKLNEKEGWDIVLKYKGEYIDER